MVYNFEEMLDRAARVEQWELNVRHMNVRHITNGRTNGGYNSLIRCHDIFIVAMTAHKPTIITRIEPMNNPDNAVPLGATALTAEELELARLIVVTLNLENQPEDIDPDAPLYGEGLGLDSIDVLELALAVSKTYGVKLRADDENNRGIFNSLRTLNQHIRQSQNV